MENTTAPYYTNEWEEFLGWLEFDFIAASEAHAKPWKEISAENLSNKWHINLESTQYKLNVKNKRGLRTDNIKLPRNFRTVDRMLIYKRIRNVLFMDTFFATNKSVI